MAGGEGLSLGEIAAVVAIKDAFTDVLNKAKAAIASLGPVGETVVKVIGGIAVAAGAAAATLLALGARGAEVADVGDAFKGLTSDLGGATASLAALRAGTLGTVSDFNLMKIANETLGVGVRLSADDLGVMARAAQLASDATGGDMVQSLQTMSDALVSGRTRAVEYLGITIQQDAVVSAYAKAHGVAADAVSDLGKKEAIRAALLDAMRAKVAAAGAAELDFGDKLARVKTWVQNATDALAVAIAQSPVVNAAMDAIGDAFQTAFGGNQAETIRALIGYVNRFAIVLVDVAHVGLTTADVLYRSWSGLKAVFLLVAAALGGVLAVLATGIASMLASAAQTPIIGKYFAEAAASTQAWANTTAASAKTLAGQAVEAGKAAAGASTVSKTIDGWKTSLDGLRAKMEAASTQTGTHVEQTKKLSLAAQGAVIDTDKQKDALDKLRASLASVEFQEVGVVGAINQANDAELVAIRKHLDMVDALDFVEQHTMASAFGMRSLMDGIEGVGQKVDVVVPKLKGWALVQDNIAKGLGPAVIGAFQGGGDPGKAIGGFLGNEIGQVAGPAIAKRIGGFLGSAIGSLVPGLGTLLGGALGGLVSKIFGGPSEAELAARQVVDAWEKGIAKSLSAQQRAEAGGVRWKETVIGVRDAYLAAGFSAEEAEAAVVKIWESSKDGAEASKQAIEDLNAALRQQAAAMSDLDETVKRYKFSFEELGPALQRQNLDKQAQQIYHDWMVLVGAGVDVAAVAREMGAGINEFVRHAIAAGLDVPAALRPILEEMIRLGKLTDEAGNPITDLEAAGIHFTDSLTQQFKTLIETVQDLIDAITRGLGNAIGGIPALPSASDTSRVGRAPRTTFGGYQARGGDYLVDQPTVFIAGEAGRERVRFSGPDTASLDHGGAIGPIYVDARGAWFDERGIDDLSRRLRQNLSHAGTERTAWRGTLGVDR